MTNAEAQFNNSLRPRKPEGSLGQTAQDGHLDSHTAPELWLSSICKSSRLSYGESPRTPPLEGTSLHRRNNSVERPWGILSLFTTCLPSGVKSLCQSLCHMSPTQELTACILRREKKAWSAEQNHKEEKLGRQRP